MTFKVGDRIVYRDSGGVYGEAIVVGGTNPWPDQYKRLGVRWETCKMSNLVGKVRFPVIKNMTLVAAAADETESFFV